MRALLCESFAGIDFVRRSPDTPEPVEYRAEAAVLALLPHCSAGFLRAVRDGHLPSELALRASLDPPTPLLVAAVDTDAQEGE